MDTESYQYFRGDCLYGDDLDHEQIQQWWKEEEYGYYDLANTYYQQQEYEYHALNKQHGYRYLAGRDFGKCLALGCADGSDVLPIAPQVKGFIGIEPAEKWWTASIGGKPATFMKPSIDGSIALNNAEIDLAVSLGVLHHIPNVSHVISEISRVLSPGGIFMLREPILTMGDWRNPRPGLTKNERGLPLKWLQKTLEINKFRTVHQSFCMFPGVAEITDKLGLGHAYGSSVIVSADALLSRLFAWNIKYYRPTRLAKIAPRCVFSVLQKEAEPPLGRV